MGQLPADSPNSTAAPETNQPDSRQRLSVVVIAVGLALSIATLMLLALRLLPTGIPGQWEWPWREVDYLCPPQILLALFAHLIPLAILLTLLKQTELRKGAVALLLTLCCLTAATGIVVLETTEPAAPLHLALTTASLPATGYFSFATVLDSPRQAFAALSGRPGPSMPPRVQTHPPGPVLFYYFGIRVLERMPGLTTRVEQWLASEYELTPTLFYSVARYTSMPSVQARHLVPAVILGLLLTALGALLPLPVYWVTQGLRGPRAGLIAAVCAATVPSLAAFIPSIDGVAAVLAVLALATWLWALRGACPCRYALAGLAAVAAIFWSLGLFALGVPMLAAAVPALRSAETRRQALLGLLSAAGTFAACFAALYVGAGYSLPGNMHVAVAWQSIDIAHSQRSYLMWLPGNIADMMLFMGPALLLSAAAGLLTLPRLSVTARHVTVGTWLALGIVWLSGSTLGEVGRIWVFLMALLLPGAALALVDISPDKQRRILVLLVLSQSCLALLLHCRLALVQP